jgi:hypothetical protein
VFESLLGKLNFEVCLLLELARSEGLGFLVEQPLGSQSG